MRALTWRKLLSFPVALGLSVLVALPVLAGDGVGPLPRGRVLAPVLGQGQPGAIPGRYIVVMKESVSKRDMRDAMLTARSKGAVRVTQRYDTALKGFAASLSATGVASLRSDPRVVYIEADARVRIVADQANPPSWGLDRIDQRNLPLNNNYHYDATGSGVRAYIIDTGLDLDHSNYGGRAVSGYDAIDGGTADDCNGHGSHVAGTVGGTTFGVAKSVTLVAVRVLNCQGSGTNSQVIAGINWVTSDHAAGQPAVANMSLGGGISTALDQAVANSIADGVTYAIAAGNSNANACNASPARVAAAITVGATTSSDARASYSNYGSCLDIFAPGSGITSAWLNNGTNTINGTSMATPHVAGVAALYLQGSPSASPATVTSAILNSATTGVVTNAGSGSPNRLLYSLFGTSPPPPPPPTGCTETYSGSLSGAGDYDFQPNGNYFFTANSGTHRGCLTGPANADFDLYLWKWNGVAWATVASGLGSTSTETITYNGTSGYYVWRIYSYSGSGSYTFRLSRP